MGVSESHGDVMRGFGVGQGGISNFRKVSICFFVDIKGGRGENSFRKIISICTIFATCPSQAKWGRASRADLGEAESFLFFLTSTLMICTGSYDTGVDLWRSASHTRFYVVELSINC